MSIKNRKFYSISPANVRMYDILAEFEREKRNVSDYICKAVIEKYDREKSAISTEDMLKTLMSVIGSNKVQIPTTQPTPPAHQPITVQEQKADVTAEPKQEVKQESLSVAKQVDRDEENRRLAQSVNFIKLDEEE